VVTQKCALTQFKRQLRIAKKRKQLQVKGKVMANQDPGDQKTTRLVNLKSNAWLLQFQKQTMAMNTFFALELGGPQTTSV
jgi:hypothetical protein